MAGIQLPLDKLNFGGVEMLDVQFNKIFGRNLREYRESLEMPRHIFASKYGGSASTLQSYEAGSRCPNFQRLLQICNTFHVSPNQLFKGLYSWPTEKDVIRKLMDIPQSLNEIQQEKLKGLQAIYIESARNSPSKLTGNDFAARLHLLRVETGYDAMTVAGKCMIARATLQGYESGQYDPSVPAVLRLCEVIGVSPEYLLAPMLDQLNDLDRRIVDLYPQQIRTLEEISAYYAKTIS